jgi:putative peptide zinc metalloprotease protein
MPTTDGGFVTQTEHLIDMDASAPTGWRAANGLQHLGLVQGSGLTQPTYLVRRSDGQVVQLSALLHLVLVHLDPDRTGRSVAAAVSDAYGRQLSEDGLAYLVTNRLQPLGLVDGPRRAVEAERDRATRGDGSDAAAPAPTAAPLLALSLRGVILPARVVPVLARVLSPLFWPPVVVLSLLAVVALDVRLLGAGDLTGSLTAVMTTPALMLGLFVVLTAAGLVHETGHAAACAYGGGRPGAIGFGVYLLFPAFYTDVTDSYRLSRAARVRTDLGGLYFNALTLAGLALAYLSTGQPVWLLAVLLLHIEMVQQLVPAVRLDGYYVLADLAGVPDLFARVGPVLRSIRPSAQTDPRVRELRPAARRTVIAWVAFVVPTLLAGTAWLLWNLPLIVGTNLRALGAQASQWATARAEGDLVLVAIASVAMVLLVVPLLGIGVMIVRLGQVLARLFTSRISMNSMAIRSSAASSRPSTTGASSSRVAPTETPKENRMTAPPSTSSDSSPLDEFSPARTEARRPAARSASADPEPEASELPILTADAFRDELILPTAAPVPSTGWRRAVYRATAGTLNPGLGPAERQRIAIQARLCAPIRGSHRIVVMSRKGGVGKTTTTFALGSTFAALRGDRVVAVDANPDAGNLAHRVAEPNRRTITDVLLDRDAISTYAQLREYTSQAGESRLEVLASDDDPRIGMALGREDYHHLISLLDRFYNLIVLDTGTGILDSANQGLLTEADQLVLVLRAGIDGGRAAALTLDWLDQHDDAELVANAVVVINAVRKGVGAPIGPMVEHFSQRCRRVVTIPWDPALEVGAQTHLSALHPSTRDSLVEMAAAVADGFDTRGTHS